MLYYIVFQIVYMIRKNSKNEVSLCSFFLALAIITLHLLSGILSLTLIYGGKPLWAISADNIIDLIFQFCILYFCWGYSTRPRFQPIVEEEEEEDTNVATEAIEEEEAYNHIET